MSQYVIDASDRATEATWQAYKQAQYNVRDQVGTAYRAVRAALAQYAALAERLTAGDLAPVVEYHKSVSAGLLDQEQALIDHLRAAIAIIEEMQAARPDDSLFPGVPKPAEYPAPPSKPVRIAVLG